MKAIRPNSPLFTFCLLVLSAIAFGQTRYMIKKADQYYHDLQFAAAVPLYQAALKHQPNDDITARIAECYRHLNDSRNAEKYFQQVAQASSASADVYLHYAYALVQNKKYDESKFWFEKYRQVRQDDHRAQHFINSIESLPALYRDSADIEVNYLSVNSRKNDFAPAFYGNGIAFCSDRNEGQPMQQVFGWNQSLFLNIFSADQSSIKPVNPTNFKLNSLNKLSGQINTSYHEGPLVVTGDGKTMFFTRNNYHEKKYKTDQHGVNRLKLFSANFDGADWVDVKELPFNSDEFSVGHPALSPDGQTLYFISDKPGSRGLTDIWYVNREGDGWSTPINLDNINSEGREMFPFCDADGNLFFASDGWGGLGGLDIFYARFNGTGFERPVNLGYPINSNKDDFSLIVNPDKKSGYFSSHRNGELTGDDIYSFRSKKTLIKNYTVEIVARDKETLQPIEGVAIVITNAGGREILRAHLDSAQSSVSIQVSPDEKYFVQTEKEGYLADSTKISTLNILPDQLFREEVLLTKKNLYSLHGTVTDGKGHLRLDSVHVVVIDANDSQTLANTFTSASGEFHQVLSGIHQGKEASYIIKLDRHRYLTKQVQIRHTFSDVTSNPSLEFSLEKIDVGVDIGKLLNVKPIYFDLGKSEIRPDAGAELDKIVKAMIDNPEMKIELGSHTDARGSDTANLFLSEKRARASANYIISKGIASGRITAKGYGETRLVNKCGNGVTCNEESHRLNRRTEFIVTSIDR